MWTQKALCLSASFTPKERFAKQSWRKFLCCLISRQLSGDTLNYELSLRTKQGKVLETQYTYVYNMVGRKYPIVWKFCLGLILVKTSMSLRYKSFCALCISWHWNKVTYRALLNCRNCARLVSYCTSTQKRKLDIFKFLSFQVLPGWGNSDDWVRLSISIHEGHEGTLCPSIELSLFKNLAVSSWSPLIWISPSGKWCISYLCSSFILPMCPL